MWVIERFAGRTRRGLQARGGPDSRLSLASFLAPSAGLRRRFLRAPFRPHACIWGRAGMTLRRCSDMWSLIPYRHEMHLLGGTAQSAICRLRALSSRWLNRSWRFGGARRPLGKCDGRTRDIGPISIICSRRHCIGPLQFAARTDHTRLQTSMRSKCMRTPRCWSTRLP